MQFTQQIIIKHCTNRIIYDIVFDQFNLKFLKNKEKKKHNIHIQAQVPRKGHKVLSDWMSLTNVYNLYCAKIKTMTTIY